MTLSNYVPKFFLEFDEIMSVKLKVLNIKRINEIMYINLDNTINDVICYNNWEKHYKPISYNKLVDIIPQFPKLYYKYISEYPFLFYVIEISLMKVFGNEYSTEKNYIYFNKNQLSVLTYICLLALFSSLEIDEFNRNVYEKKKYLNQILSITNTLIKTNKLIILFNNYSKDTISLNNDELNLKKVNVLKLKLIKFTLIVEYNLINLSIGLPIINYNSVVKNIIIGNLNNKNEGEGQNYLKKTKLINKEDINNIWEKKKNSIEIKFKKLGKRIVVFSNQINIVKDINLNLYDNPGIVVNETYIYRDNYFFSTEIFVYNKSNPKLTSKMIFDTSILKIFLNMPIVYNKILYNIVKDFFFVNLNEDKNQVERANYKGIVTQLNEIYKFKNNIIFYSDYIIDFRGRIYVKSPLSITSLKFFRYILIPYNSKYNNNFTSNIYSDCILKYKYLLSDNYLKFSDGENIITLLYFYSLGKCLKTKLLEDKEFITLESLLKCGITLYRDQEFLAQSLELLEPKDKAHTLSQKQKLDDWFHYKKIHYLIADCTASGIFHIALIHNMKEEFRYMLNIVNNDIWYDTYTVLKNLVLKNIEKDVNNKTEERTHFYNLVMPHFTRKRIKKVFMTIPYNAQLNSLLEYFCKGIDTIYITKEFKLGFFYFINIFKYTMNSILNLPIEDLTKHNKFLDNYLLKLKNDIFDFHYWETSTSDIEIMVNGVRCYSSEVTIKLDTNTNKPILDKQKVKLSLNPNVIHALDSWFLREVVKNSSNLGISIHTIHDEFIIPIDKYCTVIEIMNKTYIDMYNYLNNTNIDYNVLGSFNIVI